MRGQRRTRRDDPARRWRSRGSGRSDTLATPRLGAAQGEAGRVRINSPLCPARPRGISPASPGNGAVTKPAHSLMDLLTVRFAAAPGHLMVTIEPSLFTQRRLSRAARLRSRHSRHWGRPEARRLIPGGFFFRPCQARPAVDPAFQADAFGARSADSVARIWRPTAVRTFFEGQGGYCSSPKLPVCRPGLIGPQRAGSFKGPTVRASACEPCGSRDQSEPLRSQRPESAPKRAP